MKKLLSLPPNLVNLFNTLEQKESQEWFCCSDPIGKRVGSGGGSAWLLKENWLSTDQKISFGEWMQQDKKVLVHAGGQSRRLPAYAPSGKILTPIPVFRWGRGQKIDQNLLDIQLPLYENILDKAPKNVNTLIASGDVYIRSEATIDSLPNVDVICYGLWVDPALATNHGVFVCDRANQSNLQYMLQKPSVSKLQDLAHNNLYLMDIGIWLLSDKAVDLLMKRSGYFFKDGEIKTPDDPHYYDLYSDFGLTLGENPSIKDSELNNLSVAILPLPKGEFYHFGTSKELISSTLAIQNRVTDQRAILHKDTKPHPSMFLQNTDVNIKLSETQRNLWIENSSISENWKLNSDHIITGIPKNSWNITIPNGICLDISPIGDSSYSIRPYGFNDAFRGSVSSEKTEWMGNSLQYWFKQRNLKLTDLATELDLDIQSAKLFPVVSREDLTEGLIKFMISGENSDEYSNKWKKLVRISADEISESSNLYRLYKQRDSFRSKNISQLYKNYNNSVFYQVDLDNLAKKVVVKNIHLPLDIVSKDNKLIMMHDQMFHSRVKQYRNLDFKQEENNAFSILRDCIIDSESENIICSPQLSVFKDQIVWGRSPVRIDLAGGWTDTPPNCIINGGAVVNMAVELNGQPPLQVYIKPIEEFKVILRSIDIGSREDVLTYNDLEQYNTVGSAFSIPKAALVLVGFNPKYSEEKFNSLEEQLKSFGSGIEISTLAAIPKGSGLGTSSILATTVLGALSDFCGLNWSQNVICNKTMVLEQLLTTGGGWQDQFGGALPGIKLLETVKGFNQLPTIKWAPDYMFSNPENKACMLLYYTGITRTAKDILSEIVRRMFLNSTLDVSLLKEMKQHALHTFDVLQKNNFSELCNCVNHTWKQNKLLDSGTNPSQIDSLIKSFEDYAAAYKLPGAGGGGYMFIIAKDPIAAVRIKKLLNSNPPNNRARFVDLNISQTGFQVSRS